MVALKRAAPALCLLVLLGATAVAVERGWAAWQQAAVNRALAAPGIPGLNGGDDPRLVLARAVRLEQAQRFEEALGEYAGLEALGDATLRHAARVNAANLYLKRGIEAARDEDNASRAMALLQLAKGGYRRALRERPDDWNARYNLELAQRLLPDTEVRHWRRSGNDAEVEDALKEDKAAWTEMVGQPRGMH